jgi:ribokinase
MSRAGRPRGVCFEGSLRSRGGGAAHGCWIRQPGSCRARRAVSASGGELTASSFERIPGGKGANQAVAAARLGARVRFVGCVGRDVVAAEALVNLRGLALDVREADAPTGLALIFVDRAGENQIVVVPGANAEVEARSVSGSVLCQLEIPDDAIA